MPSRPIPPRSAEEMETLSQPSLMDSVQGTPEGDARVEGAKLAKNAINTSASVLNAVPFPTKLVHYSPKNLSEIDPAYAGSGVDAMTKGRSLEHPISHFYEYGKAQSPADVGIVKGNPHYVELNPAEHKIYNFAQDPENIIDQVYKEGNGAFRLDRAHELLKEKGYAGYHNPADEAAPNAVRLLQKVPVSQVSSARSNPKVREVAENYAKSKGFELRHPDMTMEVDPARGGKIAQAYEQMVHAPDSPEVRRAYDSLINETQDQFRAIKDTGLKISKISKDMSNPYPNGSKDVLHDIEHNNHLWYFPTESGFGTETEAAKHPLLQMTEETLDGEKLPANDVFRIVHDYFGHAKEGFGFGPQGEENAWLAHKQMYTPEAQKALTTETRGQNSWVNFGPKGEANRANPGQTTYAEQKAGLLPDWVTTEEGSQGRQKFADGGDVQAPVAPQINPQEQTQIFDISSGTPTLGTINHNEVQDAIASGNYSLPKGSQVPVFTPDGQLGTIDAAEAPEAFNNGYRYAQPHEVDQHRYGGLGQQAIAGLEGVAQGIAGPLAPMAETALGLTSKEAIAGRERANPITHYGSEALGFVAPALLTMGGSAAARLGVAGAEAAAQGIGRAAEYTLPGLLTEAAAKVVPSGGNFVTQVGSAAARGAFEGALLQGSDEATKLFLQDPNQSADTVVAHIGLSALLGGGIGAGVSTLAQATKKGVGAYKNWVGDTVEKELLTPEHGLEANPTESVEGGPGGGVPGQDTTGANKPVFVSEIDQPALEAGDFATTIKYSPNISDAQKARILKETSQVKGHASEIMEAADRLGSPVLEGMTSASRLVQRAEDTLLNSAPTYSGIARQKLYGKVYDSVRNALDAASGAASPYTKAELGNEIKTLLAKDIRSEIEPTAEIYKILKEGHKTIPLESDAVKALQEEVANLDSVTLSPSSPQAKIAQRVIQELPGLKTVDDVKRYKTLLRDSINYGTASNGEKEVVSQMADALSRFESNQVVNFAKDASLHPELRQVVENLIPLRKAADARYRQSIEKIGKLAKQLGKRNIHGPEHAINFIQNELTPEQITQRLFSKNNSEFLKFFQKEFPEQMGLIRQYQKDAIRETAMKDGLLTPSNYFRAVNKLEPEVQRALFSPDELQKIKDAHVVYESIPKAFNPSGTSHTSAFRAFFDNPFAFKPLLGANARDLAIDKFIKMHKVPKKYAEGGQVNESPEFAPSNPATPTIRNYDKFVKAVGETPEIRNAINTAQAAIKGQKLVSKSVKHVFNPESTHTIPVPSAKELHKLNTQVQMATVDPSKLFSVGSAHSQAIPEYSSAFGMTASRAVSYLNSIKPKETQISPFDPPLPPAKADKDAYDRALAIAQQPVTILHNIREGTIVPQDIIALKSIYPGMYEHLSQELTNEAATMTSKGKNIPYRTKLGLSMFMAQPLDYSLTPQGIMAAQPKPQAQQQQAQGGKSGKPDTKGLSKLSNTYQTPNQERQKELSTK
jgi:hypothetical protein